MQMSFNPAISRVSKTRFGNAAPLTVGEKVAKAMRNLDKTMDSAHIAQASQVAEALAAKNYTPFEAGISRDGEIYMVAAKTDALPFTTMQEQYRVIFGEPGNLKELSLTEFFQGNRQAPKSLVTAEVTITLPPPSFLRNAKKETQVNGFDAEKQYTIL